MKKHTFYLSLIFSSLFFLESCAVNYQFTFTTPEPNEQGTVVVYYEIFENQPFGFSPNLTRVTTLNQGQTISISLKGKQSIIFEAVYENDPKRVSIPQTFYRKELSKRGANQVLLSFYDKKSQGDYKTLTQLVEYFRQGEYTQHLLRENRETFNVDTDLPIGSLIFFDGEKAYFAPTIGIIEDDLQRLNERNYVLQDLVKVEQSSLLDVSTQLGGFFNGLTASADMSKVRFMEYRLEVVNLSKRKVKKYLKNPNTIFEQKDPWLEAVFDVLERNQSDIGKYKLYFVTSKIVADSVKLQRRTYQQKAGGGGVNLKGVVIDVEGEGRFESEKSFTEIDQFSNVYFDFEVQDLTLLMMYEFRKRITEQQKRQFNNQKNQLLNQLNNEKKRVQENFELVRIYDEQLPLENPSYTQIKSIYLNMPHRLPQEFQTDSLGNTIPDVEISSYNRKIESFNKFLDILKGNLKTCQAIEEKIAALDILIQQLDNNPHAQGVPETPNRNISNEIMQNIEENPPKQ